MIFTRKNTRLGFAILIGMLLSFSVYYNYNTFTFNIEMIAASSNSENSLSTDSDLSLDEQICTKVEVLFFVISSIPAESIKIAKIFSNPTLPLWHPPKLS